jgi:hypothetical protein
MQLCELTHAFVANMSAGHQDVVADAILIAEADGAVEQREETLRLPYGGCLWQRIRGGQRRLGGGDPAVNETSMMLTNRVRPSAEPLPTPR